MAYFHYRCGERITLTNDNCTAIRNESEFDHGLVISAEPLVNDVPFEIKIDKKVNSWSGSLEIGVVDCDPLSFDFPPCASRIVQCGSWIMSGTSVFKNGVCLVEGYGIDLDRLIQDDCIGLMRTSEGDLKIYINGVSQGVAAEGLPSTVYAIVDLYGKCVQVTITSSAFREHNNDDCLSGSSVLAIDNDVLNVTLGGDLSELSMSSSNSLDIRMDMNVSLSLPEESARQDRLRFHDRCGSLVKLSNGNRSAERRRPLDEFNNGVVMTHRPLRDNELFEIRIDRLVDKWSGSIEMGITTHNPSSLVFPATMTNMRSGTIMMSGCGILTNGKGTRREYGDFNLDELAEGDRVAMVRRSDGSLHYYVNGLDQGVAANRVPQTVWGVIDLYGMTIKVSIVERDEREEQNLITRKSAREQLQASGGSGAISDSVANGGVAVCSAAAMPDYYDRLTFHPNCGAHAQVVNNGRTALRPNAADDFNNGVVLTARTLKPGELFEVRLDRVVTKWAGSIEIGVTTHRASKLEFPFTMTNVRSGTWMMTGSGVMHNGTIVLEQYGTSLDRLQVGDRVGVVRKENGCLNFFVNGVDQGTAASNVPDNVYGVIDLYGQAVEATIIDMYDYGSPDTINSSLSNTTLYSDLRFHHVHGKNARIVNSGLTALRPRPLAEFNDAIVFSSRPLRDGEIFEVVLDSIVDRWSGCIELGVTAVRPDDIDLPSTATDLCRDTWMLSGSSVMVNGKTVKNNYALDLDAVRAGTRIGVARNATDRSLEFYRDGVPQGVACYVPPHQAPNLYAVVDLYGQCAQVSVPGASPPNVGQQIPAIAGGEPSSHRSDTSASLQGGQLILSGTGDGSSAGGPHRFSEHRARGVHLNESGRLATRVRDCLSAVVFSAQPLMQDEMFEVSIVTLCRYMAGTLTIGVTDVPPAHCFNAMPKESHYITGNELRFADRTVQYFTPSLDWLNCDDRIGILRTADGAARIFINGEELPVCFPPQPDTALYAMFDLRGACCEIAVTSHSLVAVGMSPMQSIRLQDSLEIVLDQEQAPDLVDGKESLNEFEESIGGPAMYEFWENHGRNVELLESKTVARRVASYNQGVVIVQPPLERDAKVEVIVEQLEGRWRSSMMVGLVAGPLDRLNLPVNSLMLKATSCVVADDWTSINGIKIKIRNETSQIDTTTTSSFDCEKADLESGEKERSENRLTLPIPSASTSMCSSTIIKNPSPMKSCVYKEECERIKKKLLLPDQYFTADEPLCYCLNCYKLKSTDVDKENNLAGWVKFPLKISENIVMDKWHIAFHYTKLGGVRCVVDKGQPLAKSQAEWCNLSGQRNDEAQVVMYPTLSTTIARVFCFSGKQVYSAFQLHLKPGAYSVSRDLDPVEWSTKEAGAIVLDSLLLRVQ
ncbi:unnamed protein product [Acanthoscelides obtectus]|uniref:NHR domain-containing protein n=1 Tax=Acanthoscelides obtectus TaxID=200917 RepID=A0A9P0LZ09_ACAOB|nr:unnamed protein product [Acanthoscelides obtectus]CAK1621514.1 Neuralized-like protein 4 [Acanthoscelides obtectus]